MERKKINDFSGRVAIITGAGDGLGRSHAHHLAARGAKIVVNDINLSRASEVADQIVSAGGEAIPFGQSVTDFPAVKEMVDEVIRKWGAVDILVNNAGILRDRSFTKMDLDDFRFVVDVHLMGAVNCSKALWDHMRSRNYGRIVMTTSSSGLFGNFGQSNYGSAKMALVGLMQTLALEGAKNNIRVNCIAPTAATNMLKGLVTEADEKLMQPHLVSPGVIALVREDAPTKTVLCAGAGTFSATHITLTQGLFIGDGAHVADALVEHWSEIVDRTGDLVPAAGIEQSIHELTKAGHARPEVNKHA